MPVLPFGSIRPAFRRVLGRKREWPDVTSPGGGAECGSELAADRMGPSTDWKVPPQRISKRTLRDLYVLGEFLERTKPRQMRLIGADCIGAPERSQPLRCQALFGGFERGDQTHQLCC